MGNVIQAKDNQHNVKFEYYGLGKLKTRIEGRRRIEFEYDTEEQLHTIRNEKGESYRFELDALGNVVTETGFDDLVRKYQRDPAGRVTKVQRPEKRFTNYSYDSVGNVVAVKHSDDYFQNYEYDGDGNLIVAENNHSKVKLSRNQSGQVVQELQAFDGNSYQVTSEYDEFGDRIAITSSLGAAIKHERNDLGDVTKTASGTWEANFERDILGLETYRKMSGEVEVSTQRDAIGRVVKQEVHSSKHRMRSKS